MEGQLDIFGVPWRVVTLEPALFAEKQTGGCDHDHASMTVMEGLPKAISRIILLHEVVHAITDSLDITVKDTTIQAIAVGLASIPQLSIDPWGAK